VTEPESPLTRPLIRLEEIVKEYGLGTAATRVLDRVSLDIPAGDFAALQGPSGSGKSTLLHILGLLDRPTSGRYLLQGEDVAGLDDDRASAARNRFFGFVFQSFHLVPYASALENALLPGLYGQEPRKALVERGRELFARMGLEKHTHLRPSQLSGGQQQRVALARALINQPKVVFADEPTGQLDQATGAEIMELLADINRSGTTIVIVTHDEATARYASRRVRIVDGQIAAQGQA